MQAAAIRKQGASGRGIKVVALRAGEPVGEWEVRKETVTFGRSATADAALQDNKKLSRIHCSFELRADGVWVLDAGSANGVWLNDRRVTEALLAPGDHVVAAGIRLSAVAVEAPVIAAPTVVEATPAEAEEIPSEQPTLRLLPAFDPRSIVVSGEEPARAVRGPRERTTDAWDAMAANLPAPLEPLPPAIAAALIMPFVPTPVAVAVAVAAPIAVAAPVSVAVAAPAAVPAPAPARAIVLSAAPGPFVDEFADQIANRPAFSPVAFDDAVALPSTFAFTVGGRRHAQGSRGPRTMMWIGLGAVTLVTGGAAIAALLS